MKKNITLFLILIAVMVGFFCLRPITETDKGQGQTSVPTEISTVAATANEASVSENDKAVEKGSGLLQPITAEEQPVPASGTAGSRSSLTRPILTVLETPTPQLTRIAMEFPAPHVEKIGGYSQIAVPGCQPTMVKGQPVLPHYVTDLVTAVGRVHHVTLEDAVWEEVACAPPVPSAGPQRRGEAPVKAVPDSTIYGGGGVFPVACVDERSYSLRGVHGIQVSVCPVQYDFSRGVLRYCTRGELRLVTDEAEATDYSTVSTEWNFRQLQTRQVLNANLLRGTDEACVIGSLLVIVPDDWSSLTNDLVSWKQKLGYEVTVMSYPSATGEGPFCLSDVIRSAYEQGGTHVLLLGGANDVPPYIYTSTGSSNGTKLAVSDIPYVLLEGDDLKMDMFISRMPAKSEEELSLVLSKLLNYEAVTYDGKTGDYWREKAVTLASAEDSTHNGKRYYDYQLMHDEIVKFYEHDMMTTITEFSEENEKIPITGKWKISNALSAGCSLVNYLGHGQPEQWMIGKFSATDANSLINEDELPFVASYACMTGNFGYVRTCLGTAFLTAANGGACGFLGSTNDTYLWPPVLIMQKIDDELLEMETPNRLLSQGALMVSGVNHCIDECPAYHSGLVAKEEFVDVSAKQFHLLGDCSLSTRFKRLRPMLVDYTYDDGTETLAVKATQALSDVPFIGASVCLDKGGGRRQAYRTDETGTVHFTGVGMEELCNSMIRIYDPMYGLYELSMQLEADTNKDNHISSEEVLAYLSSTAGNVLKEGQRQLAIKLWSQEQVQETEGKEQLTAVRGGMTAEEWNPPEVTSVAKPEWYATDDRPVLGQSKEASGMAVRNGDDAFEYETPAELQAHLEQLWEEHWDICRPVFIGESVNKLPIMGVKVGAVEHENPLELLIAGGIHGNERLTVAMTMKFLEWLLTEGIRHEALKDYWANTVIYVIPCMNPDGADAATRENVHEVDLNRAFPDGIEIADLGKYRDGSALYLADREPEVAAFMRWCCSRRLSAGLLVHSGSYCVAYPYGNNTRRRRINSPTPDDAQFKRYAHAFADAGNDAMEVINAALWYPVDGECPDWMYRCLGVKALTVELSLSKESQSAQFMNDVYDNHLPRFQAWLECVLKEEVAPTTETAPLEVAFSSLRHVPGRNEWLTVKRHDDKTAEEPYIVRLKLPAGWLRQTIVESDSLSAWREEAGNTVALLFGNGVPAEDEMKVYVSTTDSPEAEHVVSATVQTTEQTANLLHWNWLTAEPCTYQEKPAEEECFYGLPVYPRQSLGKFDSPVYVWNHNGFVMKSPVKPAGYFVLDQQQITCPAWFSGDVRLERGWNFIGVPWSMPASMLGGAVIGNEDRVWTKQTQLSRGKAYWVYCTTPKIIKYQ